MGEGITGPGLHLGHFGVDGVTCKNVGVIWGRVPQCCWVSGVEVRVRIPTRGLIWG